MSRNSALAAMARNRSFRRLTLAWTATNFADSALFLTLAIWVKDLTGSAGAAGLVFAAFGLPALLAPFTGHLADRVSRRRLVVVANLLVAVAMLALLAVRTVDDLWLIYLAGVVYATIGYLTAAARSGLLRDLLPDRELAAANGLLTTIESGLQMAAPLVGAGLYVVFGAHTVVIMIATLFAIAAALMRSVSLGETPPTPRADRERYRREITAGFRYLRHTYPLGRFTLVLAIAIGATGITNATNFAALEHGLRLGPEFLGVLASIQGVGAIAGGLTAASLIARLGERTTVGVGVALFGIGLSTTATNSLTLMCAGIAAAGVGVPWAIVAFITMRQRLTPPTLQGRTAAATNMAMNTPQTAMTLLAAAMIAAMNYRIMIATTAVIVLTAATACLIHRRTPTQRRMTDQVGPTT